MANLKYFDSDTNTWKTLVVGAQGPQGIQGIQGETGSGPVNAIINGAFEINQRNFTSSTDGYGFDRWGHFPAGDGTSTYSNEAFTLGSAPIAGFESARFARIVTVGGTNAAVRSYLNHPIESVRSFAGQTVTLSFYARAGSGTPKVAPQLVQAFGSGGSPSAFVSTLAGQVTLSTNWERHTLTVAIPSIAGKTLGTANNDALYLTVNVSSGSDSAALTGSLGIQNNTFDFWGLQLEAGSTATPFRRNANSLQGELAACQRYLKVFNGGETDLIGFAFSTTGGQYYMKLPTTMRVSPSLAAVTASNFTVYNSGFSPGTPTAVTLNSSNPESVTLNTTTTAGSPTIAQNQPVKLIGGASAQIILSAEL
jgi:hypothetical protein